jgi:enamine deaminase RidA (YjgF/YER057c/UK114 family)
MVTVLLHDWMYFEEMNEAFAEFFGQKPPARSTIQGERRPEGSLVAMSAIGVTKTD